MYGERSDFENDFPFPPTYLVVRFSRKIHPKCLSWFVDKIRGNKKDGGAELLVARQPISDSLTKVSDRIRISIFRSKIKPTFFFFQGVTIHLSASKFKILEVAEEMELRKSDSAGLVREFVLTELEDFLEDGMDADDLFTTAERQTIVKHELENIRALQDEDHLPGHPSVRVYQGQSICEWIVRNEDGRLLYDLYVCFFSSNFSFSRSRGKVLSLARPGNVEKARKKMV